MSVLILPIRVDALRLETDLHGVLTPLADFSALPWLRCAGPGVEHGPIEVNADQAFTSQNALAQPFSDSCGTLQRGLHLHWSLPRAMTVARHPLGVNGQPDQSRSLFPAVPNRWLVLRRGGGMAPRRWIVESDYLWPPDTEPAEGCATYLVARRHVDGQGDPGLLDSRRQPYRYIGRSWNLDAAPPSSHGPDEYLAMTDAPLTAVGYGEPTFAEFYPGCRNVFGFHDPLDELEGESDKPAFPEGLSYDVCGWYDHPDHDLLVLALQEIGPHCADLATLKRRICERFSWVWPQSAPNAEDTAGGSAGRVGQGHAPAEDLPRSVLCVGRLLLTAEADGSPAPEPEQPIEVCVGNTGTEALSAHLSRKIVQWPASHNHVPGDSLAAQSRLEHQLESLQLSEVLRGQGLDLGAKFIEARHSKTFHGVSGGTLWTLKPRPAGGPDGPATAAKRRDALAMLEAAHSADAAHNSPSAPASFHDLPTSDGGAIAALPPLIAAELHGINQLQETFDRAQAEIASLRRHIFAQWNKFITCCRHPDDERNHYPDIDEVKAHVQALIDELDERVAAAGALHLAHRDTDPASPSMAVRLARQVGRATAMLQALAQLGHAARHLQRLLREQAQAPPQAPAAAVQTSAARPAVRGPGAEHRTRLDPQPGALNQSISNAEIVLTQQFGSLRSLHPDLAEELAGVSVATDDAGLARLANWAALPDMVLAPTAAPRYWAPNDPVLLLAGLGIEASDRHAAGAAQDYPVIPCSAPSGLDPSLLADYLYHVGSPLPAEWMRRTRGEAWHPLFIEWQASIRPLDGNVAADKRNFAPSFVEENYRLSQHSCEFMAHRQARPELLISTSVLRGRSLMSAHAGIVLTQRIDDYLLHEVQRYLHDTIGDKPLEATSLQQRMLDKSIDALNEFLDDPAQREALLNWCNEAYHESLVDTYVHSPMLGREDQAATEALRESLLGALSPEAVTATRESSLAFFAAHCQDIIAWLNADTPESGQVLAPIHTVLDGRDALLREGRRVQTQALGGFHEALLMQQEVLQFDPLDPLGFADYRDFTEKTVAQAVQGHAHSAPLPHFDFHPIRSGAMALDRLRLVDTFGRTVPLSARPMTTQAMQTRSSDNLVMLPPRICQPARLHLRWLSARDDGATANPHPLTSPVCGWVVAENLTGSLQVYNAPGQLLGSLDGAGRWRTPPGRKGPVFAADIAQPQLARVVLWLQARAQAAAAGARQYMSHFIDLLDSALENIDPEGFVRHQSQALLAGRPIAVVRASLALELLGLPASDQSYEALNHAIARAHRNNDRFTQVRFPIRIGEHGQLNDGVVGYWLDQADGSLGARFCAPQSEHLSGQDALASLAIDHPGGAALTFALTMEDPACKMTLLLDPRGAVHATSGVLPTQQLQLQTQHFSDALTALSTTFLAGPLLMPAGQTELALPANLGQTSDWSWLQLDRGQWTERSLKARVDAQAFIESANDGAALWFGLIRCGWLLPLDGTARAAWPAAVDRRGPLPLDLEPRREEIGQLIDVLSRAISAPATAARFDRDIEIREGWLQFRPRTESAGG